MKTRKTARNWKYRFKHKRTIKTIKSVVYKGFKITVEKDKSFGIPYMAYVRPLSQSAKSVCIDTKNIRIKHIPDYTGWTSSKSAIFDKQNVIDKLYSCPYFKYHYV